jgi:ParB-like chromosome segregation protein Spo0J
MEKHELADLFSPAMSDGEYKNLVEDIRANGLLEPIYVYEGKVLDGWHRYKACLEAGVEPWFKECQIDPVKFWISKNIVRRHLTESQRAAIAVELLPYLEKEARERQTRAKGKKKEQEKLFEK